VRRRIPLTRPADAATLAAPQAGARTAIVRLSSIALAAGMLVLLAARPSCAEEAKTPLSDAQALAMMFIDQARSYGYQTMMARIDLDKVKAELERDQADLDNKKRLYGNKVIPLIDFEIAQLKDVWNRKQLIVAEKSLAYVSAEYDAKVELSRHFAGVEVSLETLYATFRRGWEAGCDKGPDEVAAMKAWVDYAEKSLERSHQLSSRGSVALSVLLEKNAELKIAQSNYRNREAGLQKCRTVLFPSLQEMMAIGR